MIHTNRVDLLILGAGWTSTFLIPLCREQSISYAATSRGGSADTLKFEFDPESDDPEPYSTLPEAKTVLITFPITLKGASERLLRLYKRTHSASSDVQYIQLGTTSIWPDGGRKIVQDKKAENKWYDRHSPFTPGNLRAEAEEELLALSPEFPTTVLNLSGLWGGQRSTRNWVVRVAATKEALKNMGSIHMIHGLDVSRAILAVHSEFSLASGQRWILNDGRVYDWWDLASAWGSGGEASRGLIPTGPQPGWVRELMDEEGVKALPRNIELLGRALDGRDFWRTFGLSPARARLE